MLSMAIATLAAMLVVISGSYLFFAVMIRVAPDMLSPAMSVLPEGVEWIALAILCMVGMGIAVIVAVKLARRVVAPLIAVATSARAIAEGDLSARVVPGDRSLGEAAALVDDFNRMAGQLERASGDVARWNALIAHELRTPVTILRGRLQGLVDGVFAPEEALFHRLLDHVDGLARLVEDLRTVSLTESGHLNLMPIPIDLSDSVERVVALMDPALRKAGFIVTLTLDRGECIADPQRIGQALTALLENVRRHAGRGSVRVELALSPTIVRLAVVDDGPGLASDFAPHAFAPFRRGTDAPLAGSGSGLGLSVVRAIARAHGGQASYRVEHGSNAFTIAFPRYRSAGGPQTFAGE